jgi:F-type H+-transporting ATPase subunit delta
MAELRTIARPYAEAAFGMAIEEKSLAHWSDSLAALARVATAPELTNLIGNPSVSAKRLTQLFASAVTTLSATETQMVQVLAENERLLALPEISALFETLRNEAEETIFAEVTSAFPMSDAQLKDLVDTLQKKHGKKVKASVSVDPALIGGVSIAIGDEVFDASVRGKLARMTSALMN